MPKTEDLASAFIQEAFLEEHPLQEEITEEICISIKNKKHCIPSAILDEITLAMYLNIIEYVEIEKQENTVTELDLAIEAASADYQALTRLLGEKEAAEEVLMALMEQWETAQM